MKNFQIKSAFCLILAALFVLTATVFTANAQTRRNNRQAKPSPTPPPSIPTIVSLADDRQNESAVLSQTTQNPEAPTETLDEKLERYNNRIKELNTRIKSLESTQKNEYDEKQRRLLLNLDILSRAEQRAESLRKQLFELIEKENTVKTRMEQLEFDSRPEMVDRSAAMSGSLRPEEVRDARRKSLDAEKRNLESLLTQIQTSRTTLEDNVQKADLMVEKIRAKFEKEIDAALAEEPENDN
jgi:hypothetical protein